MRALFDVNLLVALLDEEHTHHVRAQGWWSANKAEGWASCPLTENGYLRVMSQPSYPNPISISFAHEFLARQIADTDHAFWPDDVSLLDETRFRRDRMLGPKQLTDVYLLGLAVKYDGRLATLDRTIPLAAVRGAQARHVAVV